MNKIKTAYGIFFGLVLFIVSTASLAIGSHDPLNVDKWYAVLGVASIIFGAATFYAFDE